MYPPIGPRELNGNGSTRLTGFLEAFLSRIEPMFACLKIDCQQGAVVARNTSREAGGSSGTHPLNGLGEETVHSEKLVFGCATNLALLVDSY